jgi:hypothetical protein
VKEGVAHVSDISPDAMLKSALEKIVYFEARSSQLVADLETARSEQERLKVDLSHASQREIELRRVIAELEVRTTQAHAQREEYARLADSLRRERADLIGKMLDASRLSRNGEESQLDGFDLAQFIAQLRSEVLITRDSLRRDGQPQAPQPVLVSGPVVAPPQAAAGSMAAFAQSLEAQGRLHVSASDMKTLENAAHFAGRSEETLFGFSVRELSSPDAPARQRAAERLKALAHPAAAPALATALHHEQTPAVLEALLAAFATLSGPEGLDVVRPHLSSTSPEVRIAALKALLSLDATQAGPHLTAATRDPDRAVRRRASLLALGLKGPDALALGAEAIRDTDDEVRALAALVLGASGAETARALLLGALRDPTMKVRHAASQSLSRLLGQDVSSVVALDDAQRRREVRRLARGEVASMGFPPMPPSRLHAKPAPVIVAQAPVVPAPHEAPVAVAPVAAEPRVSVAQALRAGVAAGHQAVQVIEVDAVQELPAAVGAVHAQLQSTIRGCSLDELTHFTGLSAELVRAATSQLITQGRVQRRGHKYFVS